MITFGPVPSRRLGNSLGINNIPVKKICTYSCVYCQVGITKHYSITREAFYDPVKIYEEVANHLHKISNKPDYLTFVADGEPTLDINLGKSIEKLKNFEIPIAVITNASLLNDPEVRTELSLADWVSVKIDVNDESVWKKLNRPHKNLSFDKYLEGLFLFSSIFKGKLASETMLVQGLNDQIDLIRSTATLIKQIQPFVAYISVPTRPPAVSSVKKPSETTINAAYQIYKEAGLNTELLIGFEGVNTGYTGNVIDDIMDMCAVHPIREDTMDEILKKDQADPTILQLLLDGNYIKKVAYNEKFFYVRNMVKQ
jgi:wyosine [tRNA(Phe)-imidazoG37] synthetase (radical SAM superfamily)